MANNTSVSFPFLGFDLSTPATLVVVIPSLDLPIHRLLPGDNRTEQLFPAIRDLLEEAGIAPRDLRSIGVGRGPGAFTGVRNAVMAAKTFAWTLGLPLYAPTTLEVLARGVEKAGPGDVVVSLIDARRREVYCAVWAVEADGLVALSDPEVIAPADVKERITAVKGMCTGDVFLAGTGAEAYRELLSPLGRMSPEAHAYPQPRAFWEACHRAMLAGDALDPMDLLPLYIRKPDARELMEK